MFAGCEGECAQQIIQMAQQALDGKIVQLEAFQPKVKLTHKHDLARVPEIIEMPQPKIKRKRQRTGTADDAPVQLALF